MNVLVDTSVWSFALRRKRPARNREVFVLRELVARGRRVFLVGVVLQEILQGCSHEGQASRVRRALDPFPLLSLDREDFVRAASIWTACRKRGVQVGTADAQIASAAIGHDCELLTADRDFARIARHFPLVLV